MLTKLTLLVMAGSTPGGSLMPAGNRVQRHCTEENESGHDEPRCGAVANQVATVGDHLDDQRAEHSAPYVATTAEEARTANYRGGDRVHQKRVAADTRNGRTAARSEHDAAERGHRARDHEDHELDPRDVDARPARRLVVPANGVHVATERRSHRNECPEDVQHEHDHEGEREALTAAGAIDPGNQDEHSDRYGDDLDQRVPQVPGFGSAPASSDYPICNNEQV